MVQYATLRITLFRDFDHLFLKISFPLFRWKDGETPNQFGSNTTAVRPHYTQQTAGVLSQSNAAPPGPENELCTSDCQNVRSHFIFCPHYNPQVHLYCILKGLKPVCMQVESDWG